MGTFYQSNYSVATELNFNNKKHPCNFSKFTKYLILKFITMSPRFFLILSTLLLVTLTWNHGAEGCSKGSDHWSDQDNVEDMLKADASFQDVILIRKELEEIKEKVDQIVVFLSHIYNGHKKEKSKLT